MKNVLRLLSLAILLASFETSAATLQVGPGRSHKTLSSVLQVARDGDVIEIDAGIYRDEAAIVPQNDLTLRGTGGLAHFQWVNGTIGNGKGILVVRGNNVTIDSLELSGARVDDGNGAAIRVEPNSNITVRNCYLHDNQDGLLTSNDGISTVVIENSEFRHNGSGSGYTHNIYIGTIASFTLRFSYSHGAHVGHNVKSRAKKNIISYNRIMDESDGDSSYLVDIPNGGETFIVGNLMHKGQRAENATLISYGAESLGKNGWPAEIYIINNTLVNEYGPRSNFLFLRAGTLRAEIRNNIFCGPGKTASSPGKADLWNFTTNLKVDKDPGFRSNAAYDYSLTSSAIAAIDQGTIPEGDKAGSLLPVYQYVHPRKGTPRGITGPAIDIGAYEYGGNISPGNASE